MSLEIAKIAKAAAESKQASNIVVLDARGKSDICDYQLICSAESSRQTVAIAEAIETTLKQKHFDLVAIEGKPAGHWIAMDYGSTIIHIFVQSLRNFYAIEDLWPKMAGEI